MAQHYKYEPLTIEKFTEIVNNLDRPMEIEKKPYYIWETNKRFHASFKFRPIQDTAQIQHVVTVRLSVNKKWIGGTYIKCKNKEIKTKMRHYWSVRVFRHFKEWERTPLPSRLKPDKECKCYLCGTEGRFQAQKCNYCSKIQKAFTDKAKRNIEEQVIKAERDFKILEIIRDNNEMSIREMVGLYLKGED